MIKIMFICHGNICRSTMAQSYFSHLLKQESLDSLFVIDSSATSREEIGNKPHYGTKQILSKKGVKLIDHRSKQISKKEANDFDLLVCMDKNNIYNLQRIIDKPNYNKINLLLDYANINRDIADPWYTGNFELTYQDVKIGCESLLKHIKKNNNL
ncbi:MAG: low molecular weight protein-tyrosine-phosphatase [Pleomorphochaeta sp.]